jgi:hypothetical protein
MPQIFTPRSTLLLKLTAIAACAAAAGLIVIWRISTASIVAIGQPVEQIVAFSHKHHVGDVGLDCRYCHAAVEKSAFAGIPPTETCMTCHSQLFDDAPMLAPVRESWRKRTPLEWRRINELPDFVYFNHSIHVNKGVGCVSCHGRIDQMPLTSRVAPLTMQWCLDCHRDPERNLRPREHVFDMQWTATAADRRASGPELVRRYHLRLGKLADCSVCHR